MGRCRGMFLTQAAPLPGGDRTPPTGGGAAPFTTIGEAFAQVASAHAQRTAVVTRDRTLSYEELSRRVAEVAGALAETSLPGGAPIPLLAHKHADMVALHLGIASAGCCVVPLDPTFPTPLLREIIEDTGASYLLAATEHVELARSLVRSDVRVLDASALSASPPMPEVRVTAEDRAHIVYTSGSTGRPKGVVHTHASALHNVLNYTDNLSLTPTDVLLMSHAPASASALVDMYCAVLNGATLALWDVRRDGLAGLAHFTEQVGVTVSMMVPSLYRRWIESVRGRALTALRVIGLGGERITPQDVALFRSTTGPNCTLVVRMGTSETNNYALHRIASDHPPIAGEVPVGRPSRDKSILIVDDSRRPLPTGEVGEIVVRSRYMAEGYWGLPQMTSEKFGADGDERLYFTGDLGHLDENGVLWFQGRSDDQVQIHGHRVELGRVEAALRNVDGIAQAAVVVARDPSRTALVAYYECSAENMTISDDVLRRHAAATLPLHERPSHYVALDVLPMTAAQKVDRRALEGRGIPQLKSSDFDESQFTEEERSLAAVWREVLGLDGVAPDDDFFALGGHSLSAAQVIARVETRMNRALSFERFFATPTLAALAEYLGSDAPPAEIPPESLQAIDRAGNAPLSWAQWRLWYIHQLGMGSAAYNLRWVTRLQGPLDVAVIERALDVFFQRHDVLRTTFVVDDDGVPEQVVHDTQLTVDHFDLSSEPQTRRDSLAMETVGDHTMQPFDLAEGPLTRVALIRLAAEEHLLSFVTHHTVADGWSADIQRRELAVIYSGMLEDQTTSLPSLPVQYGDFARWQRQFVAGSVMRRQEDYWQRRLGGTLPQLQLPLDFVRPPLFTYRGYSIVQRFSLQTVERLTEFGARHDATLYMTLLSAWFALLSRYSGQTDILVGSPIANRRRPELEQMIGFFANSLVIRAEFDGETSFSELLTHVRKRSMEAFDHQDMPFEKLVEDLITERDLSTTPMFQNLFIFQDTPLSEVTAGNIRWETEYPSHRSAKTEIGVVCFNKPGGLEVHWEFCADLFEESTIRRMSQHYATLLESALRNPDQRITELSIIGASEAEAIESVNETERHPLPAATLHELIEAQAKQSPTAIAVEDVDRRISYAQLMADANDVAAALVARGVDVGDYVGVCLSRTAALPGILLGVMKAGAAYVPMDPTYPAERLAIMVDVANPKVVISDDETVSSLPRGDYQTLQATDIDAAANRNFPTVGDEDLVYAIFTSGSTGKPKGVEIPHRAVVNMVKSVARRPGLTDEDRLLAVTTLSFDIAALELFAPLAAGATVVIADERDTRDGLALKGLLESKGVSVLQATPATWRLLIAAGWEGHGRLTALCGGEALPPELVPELVARAGSLWNMYGPTETTVWSTCYHVESAQHPVLIGTPFDNTTVHVLDEGRRALPMNLPGELYVGGDGVARGYAGRSDLTEERFVHWTDGRGETHRLYRTGDRVRLRATGELEYLHRLDDQIKLRGFRIEPREIEAVLAGHPDVAGCAASVVDRGKGDQRLIGWVVPATETEPSFVALSKHLRRHLPDYMIPQHWQLLESLPLTPNGKLDRQALPELESIDHSRTGAYVAPRSDVEKTIAQVWARAIELDQVSLHDRFFEIGGHSLLSLQVINELRKAHGIVVTPRAMLTESVESLAAGAELTSPREPSKDSLAKHSLRDRLGSLLRRR